MAFTKQRDLMIPEDATDLEAYQIKLRAWQARNPLARRMFEYGLNKTQTAKVLGCARSSVELWLTANRMPGLPLLQRMAAMFDYNESWLIEQWHRWIEDRP